MWVEWRWLTPSLVVPPSPSACQGGDGGSKQDQEKEEETTLCGWFRCTTSLRLAPKGAADHSIDGGQGMTADYDADVIMSMNG